MPDKKPTELELEQRRANVARLYLTGLPQWKIAKELGINTQRVNLDLQLLRDRWKAAALRDFDEARGNELAKIDHVETEFWQAWERSKQTKQKTSTKRRTGATANDEAGAGVMNEAGVVREESYGDPRFLDGVLKCVEKRCRLLGLDAPLVLRDPAGNAVYGPFLTNDERLQRLAEFIEAGSASRPRQIIN